MCEPPPSELTPNAALREWLRARELSPAPTGPPRSHSCGAGRVSVLFVGRDNTTTSAAAEAIFTDLCKRRDLQCFSSHSAGTRVEGEQVGKPPHWMFVEALRYKRGLDLNGKMACPVETSDLESYTVVVCMDEQTRSEVLYMMAETGKGYGEEDEQRVVVLGEYCGDRLKGVQFRSGGYGKSDLNFVVSAMVDACNGLLKRLIESPPIEKD